MSNRPPSGNSLPPGPTRAIDINTTEEAFKAIPDLLEEFGDLVRVPSPSGEADNYLVNHPDMIRHILIKNNANYLKGPGFNRVKMLLGNGIIVSDGSFWRRQRRMIQPAFNKKVIARLAEEIRRCNLDLYCDWQGKAKSEEIIDITETASELSLMVILRVIFSQDLEAIFEQQGGNPFSFLTEDLTRDMQVVLKFRGLMKLFQSIIEQRRENQEERFDFLAMFMDARDKETGEAMTDKELIDELMTLIIAGHETSAITLQWSWYFLANNPQVEQKALAAIQQANLADKLPAFDELEKLDYIKQVVYEALRLYPPVWLFSRKAIHDDQLGDYRIPADSNIFISPYYLHRHPDFWPDAGTYDPERFTEEAEKKRHKTAFIPFSAGPRRCIGDFFAIVEMQIHFALMLPEFTMEYQADTPLELEPFINLRTRNGLKMKLRNRRK